MTKAEIESVVETEKPTMLPLSLGNKGIEALKN